MSEITCPTSGGQFKAGAVQSANGRDTLFDSHGAVDSSRRLAETERFGTAPIGDAVVGLASDEIMVILEALRPRWNSLHPTRLSHLRPVLRGQ